MFHFRTFPASLTSTLPFTFWSCRWIRAVSHPWPLQWNGRHREISVTQRSSGEPVRHGKRQFMIYAVRLHTHPNDSHASSVQSPPDTWCRPTPLHFFEACTINHLYNMVWRHVSKSIGSSGQLERFQGSTWDFLVSCLTHTCSSKMRAGPFYVCNLGFGKDDEGRTCLLTNKLFYTKLIDEANDSVLFIKVQKRIFLMLRARMDIKESSSLGSAESISQLVDNSIERKTENESSATD